MSYNKLDPFNDGSLVALYELEDTTGADSKNKYPIDSVAGSPTIVQGKYGNALKFNGDAYLFRPYTPELNKLDITISFWLNPQDIQNNGTIININTHSSGSGSSSNGGILLNTYEGNLCAWHYVNSDETVTDDLGNESTSYAIQTKTPIKQDSWQHITFTLKDGKTQNIYIDGSRVNGVTSNQVLQFTDVTNDDTTVSIGADVANGTAYYLLKGTVDNVQIFDRVLTANEVSYIYDYTRVVGKLIVDDRGSALTKLEVVENVTTAHNFPLSADLKDTKTNIVGTWNGTAKYEEGGVRLDGNNYVELPYDLVQYFHPTNDWSLSVKFKFISFNATTSGWDRIIDFNSGLIVSRNSKDKNEITVRYEPHYVDSNIPLDNNFQYLEFPIELNKDYELNISYDKATKKMIAVLNGILANATLESVGNTHNAIGKCYIGESTWEQNDTQKFNGIVKDLVFGSPYNFSDYFMLALDGTITQTKKVPEEWGTQEFKAQATNEAGMTENTFKLEILSRSSKDLLKDSSEIAFYKFNGNADDEYNTFNGENVNATFIADDTFSSVANFDGNATIKTNLNGSKAVSVWFNRDSSKGDDSKWSTILGGKDTGGNTTSNVLVAVVNNKLLAYDDSSTYPEIKVGVPADVWTHLVITTKDDGSYEYYVDGVKSDLNCTTCPSKVGIDIARIGSDYYVGTDVDEGYIGKIANLRVFNRPLAQEDVDIIYNIEKGV